MISALNSVHSVLWLIVAFINAVIFFIFLEVNFVALIFLIVYVGAIAILFLFVIMMLNLMDLKGLLDMSNYMPAGFIIGVVVFFEVLISFSREISDLWGETDNFRWDFIEKIYNIQALGGVLYTNYAYLFILASFILLVAMVGAIVLILNLKTEIKNIYLD